ncbi:hypothetical protein [Pseudomonas aeruginosa]|uniref:hypothetical protein n=1 Tax=Pseudomonas aeruginosa TaxID=287 RepID=UPI00155E3669|nr:hypothetical protein [Pseudomonas aeruginosa]NRC33955.1 hypothetical protein [Pseudomonas aeruginosa]
MTLPGKKVLLTGSALFLLALVSGVGIGVAIAPSSKHETFTVPPFSVRHQQASLLEGMCAHSDVFKQLTDSRDDAPKRLVKLKVKAAPLSDRGVICNVDGALQTLTSLSSGTIVTTQVNETFLVSVTGESELISEEFAKALSGSRTVRAMTSNAGNDGTVMEAVDLTLSAPWWRW